MTIPAVNGQHGVAVLLTPLRYQWSAGFQRLVRSKVFNRTVLDHEKSRLVVMSITAEFVCCVNFTAEALASYRSASYRLTNRFNL
jgi:hypothetical protein